MILLFGIKHGHKYYLDYKKNNKAAAEKMRIKKLVKTYNIYVSSTDILKYTNAVAVLNGFSKITLRDVNRKNPNWIFPGNNLKLIDNERIIVKKGNTMWGIAKIKLMKRHIEFYSIINTIKVNKIAINSNKGKILLSNAAKLAFSDRHFIDLKKLKGSKK